MEKTFTVNLSQKSQAPDRHSHLHYDLHAGPLDIDITHAGKDTLLLVQGGERPHIGCVVLSVPRASLTGDGRISCTSSVINMTGHKDEAICRELAEKACIFYHSVCVCTGGFHKDNISPEEIKEVMACVKGIDFAALPAVDG